VQIEFFNPGVVGNLSTTPTVRISSSRASRPRWWPGDHRPHAAVRGILESEPADNSPALIDNNPASANYGKPITQVCGAGGTGCTAVTNPFGPVGAPSADAPPLQFSVRAATSGASPRTTPRSCKPGSPIRVLHSRRPGRTPRSCRAHRSPPPEDGSKFPRTRRPTPRSASPRTRGGSTCIARTSPTPMRALSSAPISSSSSRVRFGRASSEVRSATNSKRGAKHSVGRVCARQGCRAAAPNARWRPRVAAG